MTTNSVFSLLHRVFGDAPMAAIFSEVNTIEAWLQVEAALARAQGQLEIVDTDASRAIVEACNGARIDRDELWSASRYVGYPILPLIRQVSANATPDVAANMHLGVTTQDIMDTALAMQLSKALVRLDVLTRELGNALAHAVDAHADTVMAARTHALHAVPTTLGAKLAVFLRQVLRCRETIPVVDAQVRIVSLYGAAGTGASLGKQAGVIRRMLAKDLNLEVADGPRHVARESQAALVHLCASLAAVCARLAREVIDLGRTEIGEVSESAGNGRGASSTMPQKENPVLSEATVGMAATITALSSASYRAVEAGHERSAGEWQVEWHVLPQVANLTASCVASMTEVLTGLAIDVDRMASNLRLDGGLILAEAVMFELAPSIGRGAAHSVVTEAAQLARHDGLKLEDAITLVLPDGVDPPRTFRPEDYLGEAPADARRAYEAWTEHLKEQECQQ